MRKANNIDNAAWCEAEYIDDLVLIEAEIF